ncbi:Uncharacterised protein [Vibrio cholerae]|nr:Uncharacterised protein [Vibrio cholerae]
MKRCPSITMPSGKSVSGVRITLRSPFTVIRAGRVVNGVSVKLR